MQIAPNFDGPVPGENFTSDTRNYPWHRPPDFTDINEAIEFTIERLTEPEVGFTYMAMFEAGMDVTTATDIFVTLGIGEGKWTPDMAILIAGPVSRIFEILAKTYGIEPELGLDSGGIPLTAAYLKAVMEGEDPMEAGREAVEAEADEIKGSATPAPAGGLMGAPMASEGPAPDDEQMSMLGYGPEEEEMPAEEPEVK